MTSTPRDANTYEAAWLRADAEKVRLRKQLARIEAALGSYPDTAINYRQAVDQIFTILNPETT